MAQNTLTHIGSMTGYIGHGPEVRPDAGQPHANLAMTGPQMRDPFQPVEPLGQPPRAPREEQQERPELPEDESPEEPGRDPWTATVIHPNTPSYGGAAYNGGGGQLARDMSGPGRPAIPGTAAKAIEPGKIIPGEIEDVL